MTQFQNPGLPNTLANLQILELQAAAQVNAAAERLERIADGNGPLDVACGRLREAATRVEDRIAETLRTINALVGEVMDAFADASQTIATAFTPLLGVDAAPVPDHIIEEPELPEPATPGIPSTVPSPVPDPSVLDPFDPHDRQTLASKLLARLASDDIVHDSATEDVVNGTTIQRAACAPVDPPEADEPGMPDGGSEPDEEAEPTNVPPAPGPTEGGKKKPRRGGIGRAGKKGGIS